MQVKDDARARRARRGQRTPAEGGQHVVGVDHARARAPDRGGDVVGVEPAAEQARRRPPAAERGGVAGDHLRVLAEPLADEPDEVVDRALLAAGRAVSVVEEEDHEAPSG